MCEGKRGKHGAKNFPCICYKWAGSLPHGGANLTVVSSKHRPGLSLSSDCHTMPLFSSLRRSQARQTTLVNFIRRWGTEDIKMHAMKRKCPTAIIVKLSTGYVKSCSLVGRYLHFGGTFCLHILIHQE